MYLSQYCKSTTEAKHTCLKVSNLYFKDYLESDSDVAIMWLLSPHEGLFLLQNFYVSLLKIQIFSFLLMSHTVTSPAPLVYLPINLALNPSAL